MSFRREAHVPRASPDGKGGDGAKGGDVSPGVPATDWMAEQAVRPAVVLVYRPFRSVSA